MNGVSSERENQGYRSPAASKNHRRTFRFEDGETQATVQKPSERKKFKNIRRGSNDPN